MTKQTYGGVQTTAAGGGAKPPANAPHWVKVADAGGRKK